MLQKPKIFDSKIRGLKDSGLACNIPQDFQIIPKKSIFWKKDGYYFTFKNIYKAKDINFTLINVRRFLKTFPSFHLSFSIYRVKYHLSILKENMNAS